MPNIKISGIKESQAVEIKDLLIKILLDNSDALRENISVFYESSNRLDGEDFPRVIIEWFKRPQEVCKGVAVELDKLFKSLGYPKNKVYFIELNRDYYFINGK